MIEVHAQADARGSSYIPLWSECVGAGRANEGLRAGWLEQLAAAVDDCGFRYVRFHGLFHDDMFVYRNDGSGPRYNYQYIDELFDRLLTMGIRPFVEFGLSPKDLATGDGSIFWWTAHNGKPNDYAAWADLVSAVVRHWIDRYGPTEVRRWYFEVWNEPNLPQFFGGTQADYFELYKVTAHAVKNIDMRLRVGGPATSNFVPRDIDPSHTVAGIAERDPEDAAGKIWWPVWIEEFLDYCAANELPVDFVSTHPYPTNWALDDQGVGRTIARSRAATPTDLRVVAALRDCSAYPDAEIHITEWSSSPSSRDRTHDGVPGAIYVLATNIAAIGIVESLSYWAFSDVFEEMGAGDTAFHGGFGLVTYRGIHKPTYQAYRMLNALGDEILSRGDDTIVTRSSDTGRLSAIAINYPDAYPGSVWPELDGEVLTVRPESVGDEQELRVELTGLVPGSSVVLEVLDARHGNPHKLWQDAGAPASPPAEFAAVLERAASGLDVETHVADATGSCRFQRVLPPWSAALLRVM